MITYQMKPTKHVLLYRTKLCSAILAEQRDVSDIRDIIHHSTSDHSWDLNKQVHCHDPHGKRLVSVTNLPSLLIYVKPLWFTLENGSRLNVIRRTAMGLLLKNYGGAMCGQSGEEWPQGCH